METCSHKLNTSQLFTILRKLLGKLPPIAPNQPITFNNKTFTKNREIATAFINQFTSIVPNTPNRDNRRIIRHLISHHPLNHHISPFTSHSVGEAIRLGGLVAAPVLLVRMVSPDTT